MPYNNRVGDPPEGAIPKGSAFILPWDKKLSDYKEDGAYLVPRKDEDRECLHDALERSRPPNQKGEPHMLVCNCPKCRITV